MSVYSGLLATKGGSSWFDVDDGSGSLTLPLPSSTSNGLRSAASAEESDPPEELRNPFFFGTLNASGNHGTEVLPSPLISSLLVL